MKGANMRNRSFFSPFTLSLITLSLAFGIAMSAIPATATVLMSGVPTPISTPVPCITPGSLCGITTGPVTFFGAIEPTVTVGTSNFKGTWSSPVATAWLGTFKGTGTYPYGASGPSMWNFTTLQAGNLPAGTFVGFGDLDFGSGTDERFLLQALDLNKNPIQIPWLNDTSYCSTSSVSEPCENYTPPEYVWNGTNGTIPGGGGTQVPAYTYEFDGFNVTGNPNLWYWITTDMPIDGLKVRSFSTYDGMALAAPTPEPGSLILLGSGVVGLAGLLRRRLLR